MKKILFIGILSMLVALAPNVSKAQSYEGWLGALDTLTNTDNATYEITVTGPKHCVSFQVNITKLTGTLAGTIDIYGSLDGTNYLTTAIASQVTITDANQVRGFTFTSNVYKKYKLVVATSGTNTSSHRAYVLYRGTYN